MGASLLALAKSIIILAYSEFPVRKGYPWSTIPFLQTWIRKRGNTANKIDKSWVSSLRLSLKNRIFWQYHDQPAGLLSDTCYFILFYYFIVIIF